MSNKISTDSPVPLAERPVTTLRIYPDFYDSPEQRERILALLDRYGGIDEVWLSTLEGNEALERHRVSAAVSAELAAQLRTRNIIVSLQLTSCIGHFAAPRFDHGFAWTDEDLMVDAGGVTVSGICCPSSPAFTAWTGDVLALYCVAIRPEVVYIDDDLRFNNHAAIRTGCFCARCLEGFSAFTGQHWTREKLAAVLSRPDPQPLRRQWIAFHAQELAEFSGTVARCVHASAPDTRLGLQTSNANVFYNGWNFLPAYRAMAAATGKPARVRIGGGAWNDFDPRLLFRKPFLSGCDADDARHSGSVDLITCELENYPCSAMSKSAYATVLEGALHLAHGCTSISVQSGSLWNNDDHVMSEFFHAIAEWRPLFERLAADARSLRFDGVNLAVTEGFAELAGHCPEVPVWTEFMASGVEALQFSGFPVRWSKVELERGELPSLITAESAQGMDEATFRRCLAAGVIVSGAGYLELQKQGLVDFTGVRAEPAPWAEDCELLEHPFNAGYAHSVWNWLKWDWPAVGFSLPPDSPAEALIRLRAGATRHAADIGIWKFSTAAGRMAVIGVPGEFNRHFNVSSVELYRNLFDWVGKRPLSVRLKNPVSFALMPAVDGQNRFRAVTILNAGIMPRDGVGLEIRCPAGRRFFWYRPGAAAVELPAVIKDDLAEVRLPELGAWQLGYLTVTPETTKA